MLVLGLAVPRWAGLAGSGSWLGSARLCLLAGQGGSAELPDSRRLAHNLASTLINGVWQITAQQLGINFDQRSGALDLASAVLAGCAGYHYIYPP